MAHPYDKAIEEIKAINEHRQKEYLKKKYPLKCPDCGAELQIEDDPDSPHGIKIIFVKHNN